MRAEIYIDRYVVAVVGHRENIFIINSGRGPTRKQLRVLSRIFRERFTLFLSLWRRIPPRFSRCIPPERFSFSHRFVSRFDRRSICAWSFLPFLFHDASLISCKKRLEDRKARDDSIELHLFSINFSIRISIWGAIGLWTCSSESLSRIIE